MLDVLRLSYDCPTRTRRPSRHSALSYSPWPRQWVRSRVNCLAAPGDTSRNAARGGASARVAERRPSAVVRLRRVGFLTFFVLAFDPSRLITIHKHLVENSHGGVKRSLGLLPFAAAASGNRTRAPGVRLLAPCAGLRLPFGRAPPTSSPVLTSYPVSRGERWPGARFCAPLPDLRFGPAR